LFNIASLDIRGSANFFFKILKILKILKNLKKTPLLILRKHHLPDPSHKGGVGGEVII
jgi:hypothetical protein